jgi:hypothetical protein
VQKPSRRTFLKLGTAASSGILFHRGIPLFAEPAVPLQQFAYADVQLLDGPMRQQFETNRAFFLAIDEDKLLKPYRERAGLPAPGEDMGGWYDNNPDYDFQHNNARGFAPGHSFGQYVSVMARAYAITGDTPDAGEGAAIDAGLCSDHQRQVLRRFSLSGLHL